MGQEDCHLTESSWGLLFSCRKNWFKSLWKPRATLLTRQRHSKAVAIFIAFRIAGQGRFHLPLKTGTFIYSPSVLQKTSNLEKCHIAPLPLILNSHIFHPCIHRCQVPPLNPRLVMSHPCTKSQDELALVPVSRSSLHKSREQTSYRRRQWLAIASLPYLYPQKMPDNLTSMIHVLSQPATKWDRTALPLEPTK